MKKTPLRRGKPLGKGKVPLKRRKGLAGRSRKRRGKNGRHRKNSTWRRAFFSVERVRFVKTLPCSVPGCELGPTENSHWPHRSQGGGWLDIHPLCPHHHRTGKESLHAIHAAFWELHGLDPAETNAETQRRWLEYECTIV